MKALMGRPHRVLCLVVVLCVLGSVPFLMFSLITNQSSPSLQNQADCAGICSLSSNSANNLCAHSGRHIELLILVHSAAEHELHRNVIRKHISLLPHSFAWKVIFVLGRSRNDAVNHQVRMESVSFGDILLGDFLDTYRNLTRKHIAGLTWATVHCALSRLILKVDDDIFVNYYLFKQFVNAQLQNTSANESLHLTGFVHSHMQVIRNPASKWYVSRSEFSLEQYPPFCSGWAYLTTPQSARTLLCAAQARAHFWIDDVFVTGMLREDTCVQLRPINLLFNTDLDRLSKWLRWKGRTKWHFLFSNTEGPGTLQRALHLNYQRHIIEK